MFNISAFFGAYLAMLHGGPDVGVGLGLLSSLLCWTALSVPAIFIVAGILPLWVRAMRGEDGVDGESTGDNARVRRAALAGVNAAAAGLMGGAALVLWQTIIAGSDGRVALAVMLLGWQRVAGPKTPTVIMTALVLGLVVGYFGWLGTIDAASGAAGGVAG